MILIPLDIYVILLLVISLVSVYFVAGVVRRQLSLFKIPIQGYDEKEVKALIYFRRTLFSFTVAYLILCIFPICLNIYTLFYDTERPPFVPLVSFIYAMCVHAQGLVLSFLLVRVYKLAGGGNGN